MSLPPTSRPPRGGPAAPTSLPAPEEPSTIRFRDPAIAAGFTALPNWILKKRGLSPGAKLLYALLLSYAWQSDHCWPGQAQLAADLEVTDRTVRTWLTELQAHDLLTVERRGLTQTNVYWIEPWRAPPASGAHFRADRKPASGQERNDAAGPERKQASDMKKTQVKKTQGRRERPTEQGPMPEAHAASRGHDPTPPALRSIWRATLDDLAEQVVPTNYARWLARTSLLDCGAGAAVVGAPDRISADQLARRLDPLVRRALADACGRAVVVEYRVVGGELAALVT